MTGASTLLPDGTRLRWHVGPCVEECCDPDCSKYHATKAELFADLDAEAAR